MELKKLLMQRTAFIADTQDLNIPADHVKYIDIGLTGMDCGATDADWAGVAVSPIHNILVHLGGEQIVNIQGHDLMALQTIWEDSICTLHDAEADGEYFQLMGLRLPLHVTKWNKSLSIKFIHANNAAIHNPLDELTVAYQYREQPFPSHFNIQQRTYANVPVTPVEMNLDYAGAECIGIMIYNTDLPDTSDNQTGLDQIKILVDDREIYHEHWFTMVPIRGDRGYGSVGDDGDMGDLTDDLHGMPHYRWLDFQQEPLPAGKLRALIQADTIVNATVRLVPVYIQANQAQ